MFPMLTQFFNSGQQTIRAARYIGQGFMITFIDFGICIFYGNCVEYCPTNCLLMTEEYELSTYDRQELNYNQISLGWLSVSIIDDYTIEQFLQIHLK
ncbi:NADH dehydrogenase (quinone) [Handroanthus impetiginosus]|uniref:NADH dehydrogenase (Quinone) n=1 Tax=Handroanthus impetiginosus TaxID=429701 RepID=A0A2G9GRR1_9LAMI|nr:NADH dehydrogenase (quinone) [Handroanthus impetiginosus]